MIRNLFMVVLLVLTLAITAWVVQKYRKPGSMTVIESQAMDMSTMTAPPGTMPVQVARAEFQVFLPTQTYTGTVRAFADEDVVARVTGQVVRTLVYPGDRVYPGQLLVELDSAELESKRAESLRLAQTEEAKVISSGASLARSQAEAAVAQKDVQLAQLEQRNARSEEKSAGSNFTYWNAELGRMRDLYAADAVSLEELQKTRSQTEEARTQYHHRLVALRQSALKTNQARQKVSAQQAGVTEAQAQREVSRASVEQQRAALRTAEVVLGYTQIRAQAAGTVTERPVSPGTLVMPGTVLLKIKQVDRLRLQAKVPAELSQKLRVGWLLRYRPQSTGQQRSARLSSIFHEADPNSRTVTVEALVRDPGLMPGDFVEMSLASEPEKRQLVIPLQALQRDLNNQPFVWKLVSRQSSEKPVYTCVMHPEVLSDKPGKCPKCGMDLVLKNGTTSQPVADPMAGHNMPGMSGEEMKGHDMAQKPDKTDYTCVMHPEISQPKPGKCPKCGMDLVPREKKGGLTVTRQKVELAEVSGTQVAIRKGLSPGDEVVVQGGSNLHDGMAVSKEAAQP